MAARDDHPGLHRLGLQGEVEQGRRRLANVEHVAAGCPQAGDQGRRQVRAGQARVTGDRHTVPPLFLHQGRQGPAEQLGEARVQAGPHHAAHVVGSEQRFRHLAPAGRRRPQLRGEKIPGIGVEFLDLDALCRALGHPVHAGAAVGLLCRDRTALRHRGGACGRLACLAGVLRQEVDGVARQRQPRRLYRPGGLAPGRRLAQRDQGRQVGAQVAGQSTPLHEQGQQQGQHGGPGQSGQEHEIATASLRPDGVVDAPDGPGHLLRTLAERTLQRARAVCQDEAAVTALGQLQATREGGRRLDQAAQETHVPGGEQDPGGI